MKKWIAAAVTAACVALGAACAPPRQTPLPNFHTQITPNLPSLTPYVKVVQTCERRVFYFDVQYAGWYALLANYGGIEGIFTNTIKYRQAGERVDIFIEPPIVTWRVGYSATGSEPWYDASDTVNGWTACI